MKIEYARGTYYLYSTWNKKFFFHFLSNFPKRKIKYLLSAKDIEEISVSEVLKKLPSDFPFEFMIIKILHRGERQAVNIWLVFFALVNYLKTKTQLKANLLNSIKFVWYGYLITCKTKIVGLKVVQNNNTSIWLHSTL